MAGSPIQALITPNNAGLSGVSDLGFLIDRNGGYVNGYDITLSQSANRFASPAGRTATSVTRTENDIININGWIRCVFCDGTVNEDANTYLSMFKAVMEAQKYTSDAYSTIIVNDGFMENMRLVSVNFSRDGRLQEETLISSTWEATSVAGDLNSPLFTNSGLV